MAKKKAPEAENKSGLEPIGGAGGTARGSLTPRVRRATPKTSTQVLIIAAIVVLVFVIFSAVTG